MPKKLSIDFLIHIIFVMAIALKPLYLTTSGGMQISDVLFVVLLFVILLVRRKFVIPVEVKTWLNVFVLLIVYQIFISAVWQFLLISNNEPGNVMFFSLFYIFNFLIVCIFIAIYSLYGIDKLRTLFLRGILLSSLVCLLGAFIYSGTSLRNTGFFNNPNQLGYYSVIIITIAVLFNKYMTLLQRNTLLVIGIISVVLSLSKAALVGSAVVLVLGAAFSSEKKTLNNRIKTILLILFVFTFLYIIMFLDVSAYINNTTINVMRRRLFNMMAEHDSDFSSGRGYGRIGEIGLHVLWGVGEGAYYRFDFLSGKEVHSLYVSLLVSYGIVGFVGYMYLIIKPLINSVTGIKNLMLFSGILLYGLTHNGIRNTLLWGTLAVLLLQFADKKLSDRKLSDRKLSDRKQLDEKTV